MTDDSPVDADAFYDALEAVGRPILTATRYARVYDTSRDEAVDRLEELATAGAIERFDASADPVVWYPAEWRRLTDRERVILFPGRRQIVVDDPEQFTRAQLSQFASLVDTTAAGAYLYEIDRADVWQAPYDSFEDLLGTVRSVLPERSEHLESWMEEQYKRANQFTLRTHEDGYVVLAAETPELMGNVARERLDDGQLRAPISETESWVAEEAVAEVKRVLYEAGYPVRDERDLETGEDLPVELDLELRPYQAEWVSRFLETNSGVLVGPPGSGKTVAAMAILAEIEGETLILVPGRELARQWHEELLAHTTLTEEQVGEYHGGQKQVRPVTIATYSIAGMDRHRQLFDSREWGLLVYDECLTGDTVVETPDGRSTFDEFDEQYNFEDGWNSGIDEEVRTYVPGDGPAWTAVTGVYKTESPVERIETTTGHTVTATESHTHLVFDPDTCEVHEQRGISEGDFLVMPLPAPSESARENTGSPRAELLGWFIGDGHLNEYDDIKFSFGHNTAEQIGILTDLCDLLDVGYSTFENKRGDVTLWVPKLREPLGWEGERGDKTTTVSVPDDVFDWSDEDIGALLRGLFDAEGSVGMGGRIQFNTTSPALADDVTLLFRRLGILSRRFEIEREDDDHNTVYRLTIPTYYNDRFAECVGFRLAHKRERVEPGGSPATGLPIGPYLRDLKQDTGLTNEEIAAFAGVSQTTISDVIRGSYRLGQPRIHALADGLSNAADVSYDDPTTAKQSAGITYATLGDEMEVATATAVRRLERGAESVSTAVDAIVERRQTAMRDHSERLRELSGLCFLEVSEVNVAGTEAVYDFETEAHTFVADGFLTHNCHHIPSPIYRRSADLQTRHRLGLSSTPVRGDDREEEIFTLVGPPIGTDWDALFEAGFVAEPTVDILYVPWGTEAARNEYVSAEGHERRQLAAANPAKADELERLLRRHPEEKALVFVDYLDQGRAYADRLDVPFVSGETPHHRREKLFEQFREGTLSTLVVSRVGDEGLDLPSAELAIVASGLGGSRRQGAQRAGRTMRPTGRARMYVLATRGTREEEFARQRSRHLAEKGVRVTERDAETVDESA